METFDFIMRDTSADQGESGRKAQKTGDPNWDQNKLATGDHFSCISYLKVTKIDGNKISVQNHLGGNWIMSKDLLVKNSHSADHYEKEIKVTMTDLSQLIEQCSETIFKVSFKKKVDPNDVAEKLQ